MTWQEIKPRHGGRKPQTTVVMRVDDKGRMVIYLGAALVRHLGWRQAPRAIVQRGEGVDSGRLRISPLPSGEKRGYTLSVSSGKRDADNDACGRSIAIVWDGLNDKAAGSFNVRFRIGERVADVGGDRASYIEIDIPQRWLLAKAEAA